MQLRSSPLLVDKEWPEVCEPGLCWMEDGVARVAGIGNGQAGGGAGQRGNRAGGQTGGAVYPQVIWAKGYHRQVGWGKVGWGR